MDATRFFLLLHERLQTTVEETLLHGLTDDQLRRRPRRDGNSIAWLLWHMARCEDIAVSRFVVGCPQLLAQGRWDLNLARGDIGTGMTDDEVDAFSARVNVAALRDYYTQVVRKTRDVVVCLRPEVLDEVIDPAYLRQVLTEEDVLGERAGWVAMNFVGRTKGWFLAQLALRHNVAHLAEASVIRGLIEAGDRSA